MHRAGRSVANAGGGQESISEQSAVTGVMRSRVEAALSRVQGALGSTHPANAHVASSDGPSAGAPCDIIALEQGEGQSRDMDHASMHGRGGRRVEDCEQARVSGSARTAQSADGAAAGMEGGRGSRGAGGDRCDGDVMCATSQRAETSGDGREGGEERALESRIGGEEKDSVLTPAVISLLGLGHECRSACLLMRRYP